MAAPKQGGFKISLGSLKAKTPLKASPLQKDVKRPRLALGDDEPDDSNTKQEIVGWDAAEGGALDAGGKKQKAEPRVIPALPNRDWRAESQRKQAAKVKQHQAQNGDGMKEVKEEKIQYGLTILKKDAVEETEVVEMVATESMEVEKDNLTEEQRLEKKALDALLNGKSADDDFVIPIQAEDEAFLNDLQNAPDAPTLEAYEATPIEGFGAAMLRGMGWNGDDATDGNKTAGKSQEVKRRPALLGIGAKEEAAADLELGVLGGKGKGKGKKVVQSYNPVTLRNKHTGELITEEELKVKLENQDMVQEEGPEKGRRRYDDEKEDEEGRREKRREKRDEKYRDRRRDDDYDDSDRRREKRRDRDDDYDRRRRKDNRQARSRDDDYDSERRKESRRDRSRSRSRSPDSKKEKHKDRYRSRSRDSKKRRDRRDASEDSEDRRKRRRNRDRESEYDDHRSNRKRRHRDDKYHKY